MNRPENGDADKNNNASEHSGTGSVFSPSESDSYSSFDSENSDESEDDEGEGFDESELEWNDGTHLTLENAYVHASHHSLLFPHFVECVVRLIFLRYGAVVPQPVLDSWRQDQEDYERYYGGEGGHNLRGDYEESTAGSETSAWANTRKMSGISSQGTDGPQPPNSPSRRNQQNRPSMGRKMSAASSLSESSTGQRRNSNVNSEGFGGGRRISYLSNASSKGGAIARETKEENPFFRGNTVDTSQLALNAVRLRYALEIHFWPLQISGFKEKFKESKTIAEEEQNRRILAVHADKLRKVFSHFAYENEETKEMEMSEFIFMVLGINIVDERMNAGEATNIALASFSYLGTRGHDLMRFEDFVKIIFAIADYKTYDGVCDRKRRIETFLNNELYVKVAKHTAIDTTLW